MNVVKAYNKESLFKIKISTLGCFEIRQQNKGVYKIERSTKLWDLFKYLLVHNGKGIAPEIILDDLYADDSYKNVKNSLQNNVYRLRKLLNEDQFFGNSSCNIIFSNGCYSLNISADMSLDTDIFEENLQMANLCKATNSNKAIIYLKKAFSLYRGDYFPELVYENWVIPKRNYYRRRYIQSVLQLTELYNKKQSYDNSIRICEKALQIVPYEEEVNIRFMECLIKKGSINEAQRHYAYITSALYKQFGIKPTGEMQQIYKMLKETNTQPRNNRLFKDLIEDEASESGAFYCDAKVFRSLFILEKRRSERTGVPVSLVSVTLEDKELLENVFQELKKFFIHSLRGSDAITTWNDLQLLLLLCNIDVKLIRALITDKIEQFKAGIHIENLCIKLDVHSFLPS